MNKSFRQKLKDDVGIIKQNAFGVIKIIDDQRFEFLVRDENVRLPILAIIGEVENYGEVILCEIGLGATRPYHKSSGASKKEGESEISYRKKLFFMSSAQHELVASFIFNLLKTSAYERVLSWKRNHLSNDPFMIKTSTTWWFSKTKKMVDYSVEMVKEAGIRFSVSIKDKFFLQDIYWADRRFNQKTIRGLTNNIDLILHREYSSSLNKERILKLNGIRDIESILNRRSLSQHIKIEIVRRLRDKKRNINWDYVAEMIGWDGKDTKEHNLRKNVLLKPESRLGNVRIKIITGLEAQKDCVVFEVIPQKE